MQIESQVSSSKQLQTAIIRLLCIHGRMEISLSSVLLISSEQQLRYLFQFSPQTLSLGEVTTHLTFTFPFLTPAQACIFPPWVRRFDEDDWRTESRLEREAVRQSGAAAASRAKHSPPSGHQGRWEGTDKF